MGTKQKYKVIKKKNEYYIVYKSQKKQYLNKTDWEYIKTHALYGIMPMELKESRKSFTIYYNATGYCSLKKYLKTTTINKTMFYNILNNILKTLKNIEQYLDKYKLVVNLQYVMINTVTQDIGFMYVPVQYWDCECDLRKFLENIVYQEKTHFSQNEDTTYVKDYMRVIKKGIGISLVDLEEYVMGIGGNSYSKGTRQCIFCGKQFPIYQKFCSICGNSLENASSYFSDKALFRDYSLEKNKADEKSDKGATSYDYQRQLEKPINEPINFPNNMNKYSDTVLMNNTSMKLYPYEEVQVQSKGKIVRLSTGKSYPLEGEYICIGRGEQADMQINDNISIGRIHAFVRLNEYGIVEVMDYNSRNGTYIDDKMIESGQWVALSSTNTFRLADENFFYQEK